MNARVKIIVATHKKYQMPKDEIYLPLQVGSEGKLDDNGKPLDFGYQKDNTGDNISEKNACFGSLTGLYWMWKNLDADYLGLVHYRRHFLGEKQSKNDPVSSAIKGSQLIPMLDKYKVFVPKKRKYYIETIYSHYSHTMNGGKEEFDLCKKIIGETCPEYSTSFDKVMNRRWAYMFNIMILKKDLMDDYCGWLFPILFTLEKELDTTGFDDFDKRYAGRVSERLFNVWLEYKIDSGTILKSEIKELPYMENVNWKNKITSFIKAKILKKKYKASF